MGKHTVTLIVYQGSVRTDVFIQILVLLGLYSIHHRQIEHSPIIHARL